MKMVHVIAAAGRTTAKACTSSGAKVLALIVWAMVSGCSPPADVTETGALLIRIRTPDMGPIPDELRVSVYDDGGVVFKNARIPGQGAIVPPAPGQALGTVLVQPGVSQGAMRVHVRGLSNGGRILDGVGRVPSDARQRGIFELTLGTKVPFDDDLDDVPDLIDDCLTEPDPDQTGCANAGSRDGGTTTDAPLPGDGGGGADGGGATGGAGGQGGGATSWGGNAGSDETGGAGRGGAGTGSSSGGGGGGSGGSSTGGTGIGGNGSGGSVVIDAGAADSAPVDARPADVATDAPPKGPGGSCTVSSECASKFCVDRVCCKTVCDQPCQACGSTGTCAAVVRAKDTPECAGTKSCNASGKCVAD